MKKYDFPMILVIDFNDEDIVTASGEFDLPMDEF